MENRELNFDKCKVIIDKIHALDQYTRINLAGGEPMLAPHLQALIDYIVEKGFECSLITNGSLLTEEFIKKNKNKLSMIGISIDSMDDDMNDLIGRKTITNIQFLSKTIKDQRIRLKINICISKINMNYDFESLIKEIEPDRLKLMQVLPAPHCDDANQYLITDLEFKKVCESLSMYHPVCETNEYMINTYDIVDSEGNFGKDNLHLSNQACKISLLLSE